MDKVRQILHTKLILFHFQRIICLTWIIHRITHLRRIIIHPWCEYGQFSAYVSQVNDILPQFFVLILLLYGFLAIKLWGIKTMNVLRGWAKWQEHEVLLSLATNCYYIFSEFNVCLTLLQLLLVSQKTPTRDSRWRWPPSIERIPLHLFPFGQLYSVLALDSERVSKPLVFQQKENAFSSSRNHADLGLCRKGKDNNIKYLFQK